MLSGLRAQVLRKSNKAPPHSFLSRTPGFVCNGFGVFATETSHMSVLVVLLSWVLHVNTRIQCRVININIAANRSMAGVALRERRRLLICIRPSVESIVEIWQQSGPSVPRGSRCYGLLYGCPPCHPPSDICGFV